MKVITYCILFVVLIAIALASGSIDDSASSYEIDKDYWFEDPHVIKTNYGWTFYITELKKHNVGGKVVGISYYREDVLPFSPVDFCMGWGKIIDPSHEKFVNFSMSYRYCNVEYNGPELSTEYITTHSSNNHLIPSNKNIFDKLMSVNEGDIIEIRGSLVNVSGRNKEGKYTDPWVSSVSNNDSKMGACEIILVDSINIQGELPEETPESPDFLEKRLNLDRVTVFIIMLIIMSGLLVFLILRRR